MRSFRMRLVTFLLSVVFVFAMLPARLSFAAVVETGKCGDNLNWTYYDSGKLTIEGSGEMYDYVSQFDAPWYKYRTSIQSLELSEGLTYISDHAFYECVGLTSIKIPDSVTRIDMSFLYCYNLKTITFGKGLKGIDKTFQYCSGLTDVVLPDGLEDIGGMSFRHCTGLKSVTIPGSILNLHEDAFEGCSNLASVTIDKLLLSRYSKAFDAFPQVKFISPSYTMTYTSDSNGTISGKARVSSNERIKLTVLPQNGYEIQEVTFKLSWFKKAETLYPDPDDGKYYYSMSNPGFIGNTTFNATFKKHTTHKLSKVEAKAAKCDEAGYESHYKCKICGKLFSDSKGEKEISKPVAIPKLGHQLDKLKKVAAKEPTYSKDGNIDYYICPRCNKLFRDRECKKEITKAQTIVPKINAAKLGDVFTDGDYKYQVTNPATDGTGTVTLIGVVNKRAAVSIPNTAKVKISTYRVDRISSLAFYKNTVIKSVSIGEYVKTIDNDAFNGCKNLKKVSGGLSVETIGSQAFANCKKLKKFSISSPALCKIGAKAFNKDKKLKTLNIKKTIKLTKAGVKKSLKGSKVKTVKVKKSKVKKYKKFFKKSNSGRRVVVKK